MKQQLQQQQRAPMFQRGPAPKPVPIFKISDDHYHRLRSKFPASSPRTFNNCALIDITAKKNCQRNKIQNQRNNNNYNNQNLEDFSEIQDEEKKEEIKVNYEETNEDVNAHNNYNDDQEQSKDDTGDDDGIHTHTQEAPLAWALPFAALLL